MKDRRLEEALRHLDPAPGKKLWHGGASVVGALRGVSPRVAEWKPYADRHSIWELALHIAYWNYAVTRRLTDGPSGGFARKPSNWPDLPREHTAGTWKADRELIKETHGRLVAAIHGFDASRLDDHAKSEETTYADLVTGIVLHDTYHTGQVQLLKRLAKSEGIR